MKHLLIEYCANDMLPGDWGWYVLTYEVEKTTGARDWRRGERFEVAIYEFPARFRSYSLVPIEYTPAVCLRYGEKAKKAPPRVRIGIALAVRDSLIRDVGEPVFAESAFLGAVRTREGVLSGWRVALIKEHISTPIGTDDSPNALAPRLSNIKVADSDKYSLILREDFAWKLNSAQFPGCRMHWVDGSSQKNA